jgi:hypothetical protein
VKRQKHKCIRKREKRRFKTYEFEMEGIKKNDRHKFIREVNLEKDRKIDMNRNRKKKQRVKLIFSQRARK